MPSSTKVAKSKPKRILIEHATGSTLDSTWQIRAERLLAHEISFIMNESFRQTGPYDAAVECPLLASALFQAQHAALPFKKIGGKNAHYERMCATPLLSLELEQACFWRYNWLKFRANMLRSQIDLENLQPAWIEEIERLLVEADAVRNLIAQANCRLAMSIVKKYAETSLVFDELLSDAITTLIGAIEKFDYARGFRFSTYATRSIHRRLFRVLAQRQKHHKRYRNNTDEVMEALGQELETDEMMPADNLDVRLQLLLDSLEPRERLILEARFGLHTSGKKQTFLEIGQRLKISKERVRQLAEKSLLKLRQLVMKLDGQSCQTEPG